MQASGTGYNLGAAALCDFFGLFTQARQPGTQRLWLLLIVTCLTQVQQGRDACLRQKVHLARSQRTFCFKVLDFCKEEHYV